MKTKKINISIPSSRVVVVPELCFYCSKGNADKTLRLRYGMHDKFYIIGWKYFLDVLIHSGCLKKHKIIFALRCCFWIIPFVSLIIFSLVVGYSHKIVFLALGVVLLAIDWFVFKKNIDISYGGKTIEFVLTDNEFGRNFVKLNTQRDGTGDVV